jgi:hypothetical protein
MGRRKPHLHRGVNFSGFFESKGEKIGRRNSASFRTYGKLRKNALRGLCGKPDDTYHRFSLQTRQVSKVLV